MYLYSLFFFFFQAEDGIRDDLVTGVQTCALPIYIEAAQWPWVRAFSGAPNSSGSAGAPGVPLVPITGAAGNLTAPVPISPWNSLQSTFFDDPRYQDPWSEQWNLAVEKQLSPSTLISVGYVGSLNGHMAYTGNANAAPVASASNTAPSNTLRTVPCMHPDLHYTQPIT